MLGKVKSALPRGTSARLIDVECDIAAGMPYCEIVGNLAISVKESRDRVRTAMRNSGIHLPPSRVTVNLSPSSIRKEGTHFDLAIAAAMLLAMGVITEKNVEGTAFAGELALDGSVLRIRAILPMSITVKESGLKRFIVPYDNSSEGAVVDGVEIIGVRTLDECIAYLQGKISIPKAEKAPVRDFKLPYEFSDVKGQKVLKRAALVAAASMHNMLIIGPPGAGKSMTASRLPSILPSLNFEESLEISKIYSVAGLLSSDNCLIDQRPFRNPHYSISKAAFAGGGANPMPGEMSLASMGVLFMDEFSLFRQDVIETLRTPLETGVIRITRSYGDCEYNASFMLVAAMNPCKCGFYPDRNKCRCSEIDIRRHMSRLSKPIMDRIDICVRAERIGYDEMGSDADEYTTAYMKEKVEAALKRQKSRYEGLDFYLNSQVPDAMLREVCDMTAPARDILKMAYDKYDMSARGFNKVLKVARTVADVEGHEIIEEADICEAVGYKSVI